MGMSNAAAINATKRYLELLQEVEAPKYLGTRNISGLIADKGDICTNVTDKRLYVYLEGIGWERIEPTAKLSGNVKCHSTSSSICPSCGARLPLSKTDNNGICKCEYCDSEIYVWDHS